MTFLCVLLVCAIASGDEPQPGAADEASLRVELHSGGIRVRANDVPLRDVLEALSTEARLSIVLHGPLSRRISTDLESAGLREIVRRLLRNESYLLQTFRPTNGSSAGEASVAGVLRVFDDNSAGAVELIEPARGSEEETAPVLLEGLPPQRLADAVRSLTDTDAQNNRQLLEGALLHESADVGEAVLGALSGLGGESSVHAIGTVLLSHPDSARRELAVYALAEIGGAAAIAHLRTALMDEDESTREAAADVLASLAQDR